MSWKTYLRLELSIKHTEMIPPTGAHDNKVCCQGRASIQICGFPLDRVDLVSHNNKVGTVQSSPEVWQRNNTQAGISPKDTGSNGQTVQLYQTETIDFTFAGQSRVLTYRHGRLPDSQHVHHSHNPENPRTVQCTNVQEMSFEKSGTEAR